MTELLEPNGAGPCGVARRYVAVVSLVVMVACGGEAANGSSVDASVAGDAGVAGDSGGPNVLVRIDVTPATLQLPVAMSQQLTATGVFHDNTMRDLTSEVAWTSDPATTLTVSATGRVTAMNLTRPE